MKFQERINEIISVFSPEYAVKRARDLSILNAMRGRGFEAADKGRRTKGWKATDPGPKGPANATLRELRQRSRDLVRNNGWANNGVNGIPAFMVGSGITAKPRVTGRSIKRRDEIINQYWKQWCEGLHCDFDGVNNFFGLQILIAKTLVESGEVLIKRSVYRAGPTLVLPKVQVLEPDFLDSSKDTNGTSDGGYIAQGIEFDSTGKRVAYHIFRQHPSNVAVIGRDSIATSDRVDADLITHVYRVDRAGQIRGIPWLTPAVLNLWDLDGYEDAELVRKKIASCFAAFITKPDTSDFGGDDIDDAERLDKIRPGVIEYLNPGDDVKLANPPRSEGYQEYTHSILHKIAAALGCPFTLLTGNYSQVNFSSGRLGWLAFWKNIDVWRWNILIPRAFDPIFGWFLEDLALSGVDTSGVVAEWTAPKRDMIDPVKEIAAQKEAIKAGLKTLPEAIREEGYDPDAMLDEAAEYQKKVDAAGLRFDIDMRIVPKEPAPKQN